MNLTTIKSRAKIFLMIGVLALILIGYWIYSSHKPVSKMPVLVRAQPVRIAQATEKITAVGTLNAPQDIFLSAQVNGYVTKILFQDGQSIQANDVLFQLDDIKEQANALSTQADYQQALNKYQRMEGLVKRHYVSSQDIDIAKADVQAKLAAVKTAQDDLAKKTIRAPFTGMLGARTVNLGDYVTAGLKLVELVNRSVLKVDYSVPEKYLELVKLNQPVAVTSTDISGKAYWGKVVYIAPSIDPQTHTLTLQASIPNVDNELAPGLFVQVQQFIRTNQQAVLVPEQSLVKSIDKVIVYRVVNNKAIATPVQLGTSQNGYVEIQAGLAPKDVIVTAGAEKLNDGDLVQIVK